MTSSNPPVEPPAGKTPATARPVPQRERDRSPLNWLLLVPIVVPLLVPLYNATDPTVFGFPRFYWLQLLFIVIGVGTTTLVYQSAKRRR